MNILVVTKYFPAPSETFILNQIVGLIDNGHDVRIYADKKADDDNVHEVIEDYGLLQKTSYFPALPDNIALRVLGSIALFFRYYFLRPVLFLKLFTFVGKKFDIQQFELIYKAIPFLSRNSYDVIHCHFAFVGLRFGLLKHFGVINTPLLVSLHGKDVNLKRLHGGYYKYLFENADAYTANTKFTAQKAEALGCPHEKIQILHVGLSTSKFKRYSTSTDDSASNSIVSVGRLVEKKGFHYSIEAITKVVANTNVNFNYYIIGDGPDKRRLQQLIDTKKVSKIIQLVGKKTIEEVIEYYNKADLFILPSIEAEDGDSEGQGLVLQEAQAMEIPVIGTNHNGLPEGVLEGESGFIVPEKDVDSLAEKVIELLGNSNLRIEMGKKGRKFVIENFEQKLLNNHLIEIYQNLIGRL